MTLGLGELHKLRAAGRTGFSIDGEGEQLLGAERRGLLASHDGSPSSPSTAPATREEPRDSVASLALGLTLYAICTLCSTGMSIFAKLAAARGIPVFEAVLVRSLMMASISWVKAIHSSEGQASLLGNRRWLLVLRGVLGFGAGSCLYWAVILLPLSDGLVLTSFTPVLVALLSPIMLAEWPSKIVIAGIPFCIAGVVMIARPSFLFGGTGIRMLGVAVALLQCLFSALVKIMVREARNTETTDTIVFYLGWVSSLGAAVACLFTGFKVPSDMGTFLALIGTGVMGYASQLTMTLALRRVKASPATTMSYLSVVWGIIAGITIFHEHMELWSFAGAAVICGSTLAVALLEQRRVAAKAEARKELGAAFLGVPSVDRSILMSPITRTLGSTSLPKV